MPSNTDVARELYVAFERADPKLLLELLHPDFVGHVSEGMPGGLGGTHAGPAAMLTEVWAPVWRRFGVRPVPDRFLSCDDGTVVVTGTYVGQPPDGTPPLEAAFAHVLALRDGQVRELRQITDTQRWAQAAAAADAGLVRQLFAAVEERDGAAVLDAYATGVVIREAPSLPYGGVYHGHDGALRHALAYTATWDHLQSAEDRKLLPQIRGHDDRVVVTWHQKATARDGRHLDVPVVDLIGLRDGKVASLEMFQQDTAAVLDFLAHHEGNDPG
jgi:ketosteroid isomerase-like protein